jgi:hypothetical protein
MFYKRIFDTETFKTICGSHFNSTPVEYFAKPMALSLINEVLHPDYNEDLRTACRAVIGRTCCQMFLENGDIDTETDIDTFIADLERSLRGKRVVKRRGDLIYDETNVDGQCCCPVFCSTEVKQKQSIRCMCSKSAKEALFGAVLKHPVRAELLDSPLHNGSDVCRWLIHLNPV